MAIKESIQIAAIKQAYAYLDKDPDANLPRLMDLADKMDTANAYAKQREAIRAAISDPGNNWYKLVRSLWDDVDDTVRKKLFENFVINANFLWAPRREAAKQQYNCNIPWAILMDPTSACNLHCTGCWAAEYGNKLNLTLDEMDSVVRQAKELGTYFIIFSGGEPMVRKQDILTLCQRHPDCAFLAFTNGTLIDEAFADEMLRVKNFVPAISVEGFEEATDFRRGAGTYQKVVAAMELLKRKRLPFGISCCYTSKNTDVIGSEAYFDRMIELGAKFMWLFTYMPVGKDAVPDLMVTAEQRAFMYRQVRAFRDTKPIFTMDFWNDGEYADGCIAGGRRYLHINAGGDIEPCAFIHYSDSNIREKTLLEAYQSPLFMAYHNNQPFNDNMLRPCPLLDNQGKLAEMVDRSGAHSTDLQNPEDVHELCAKCKHAADCWEKTSQELWEASGGPERWERKKIRLAERDESVKARLNKK